MNNKSNHNATFEDDEIFEDSSILANFNNSSFREATTGSSGNNLNDSLSKSGLNVSALCCDEEISGYDKITGQTWIYPTNYPVRDYQFNIIQSALLNNTLVSLPTGLGKTFIAAVIMYNFYRWYPLGKIVFTAPTRPLVAQQIEACYDIVAIPPNDTVEMTGHMQVNTRKAHWQTKRVFFATPQVIYNDIKSGICPPDRIRCLVIDEAHRARGNYAYCQIVSTLTDMGCKTYRMLALSATPGSKVEDVVNVVKNLNIAHLELRTESCIDVAPYSHARKINTVIVQLGPELTQLRQLYVEIMDGYARRLKQLNILPHNLGNLSKGRVVMLYKEFQTKDRGSRHPQHNYIMKDFTLLIALYHGLELLVKHGSRVFLNFFDEHPEKSWIQSDDKLTSLLERLRDDLGINPLSLNTSILPDGTIPEIPSNLFFGHPKFYKLKEIMLEHFSRAKEKGQDTRAIVFCEYRESVNLVHCLLLQCRPLITPQMFVGQGASGKDGKAVVSQKQQLRVMRNFREGACNTLVATCVAEEGLDVGSVDLILCFDISTRSPVRLVQRCGRTGRERGGQVFILVTEGREHQTLIDCMRQRDGLNKKIQQSKEVQASLYTLNPRMLPRDFRPQCRKMYITVSSNEAKHKDGGAKPKKGQKDLRTMLLGRGSSSSSNSSVRDLEHNALITEEEFNEAYPEGFKMQNLIREPQEFWKMNIDDILKASKTKEQSGLKLSTWLEWQRTLQKTVNIGHSSDTDTLAALLQYSDAKRFEMPASTQNPCFNTQDLATQNILKSSPAKVLSPCKSKPSPGKTKQAKKKQKLIMKSPGKKDGDIRALFSTATKSTKNYTKLINDLGVQNDGSIPTRLISLLVDLSLDNTKSTKKCYICQNICDCNVLKKLRSKRKTPLLAFISDPKFPDLELIDDIDVTAIVNCAKKDDKKPDLDEYDDPNYQGVENNNKNSGKNFDLDFDFDSPIDLTSPDPKIEANEDKVDDDLDKNFDLGDIEDIFADSSPEEVIIKEVTQVKDENSSDPKEALGFFGLNSIDDIFADSDDSADNKDAKTPEKTEIGNSGVTTTEDKPPVATYSVSPSLLSGRPLTSIPTSPILCSQARRFKLSTKKPINTHQSSTPKSTIKRRLIPEAVMPEDNKSKLQNSLADTTSKSMFTITQLVDMINKTGDGKCNVTNITTIVEDERSTSPILLTQADRKKSLNKSDSNLPKITTSQYKKVESLIILESDSDSADDTQDYDIEEKVKEIRKEQTVLVEEKKISNDISFHANSIVPYKSPINNKRKLEDDDDDVLAESPFFNKKQKCNNNVSKKLSLQEKVLAAITSNKINKKFNNETNINFVLSPMKLTPQKENEDPYIIENDDFHDSDGKKDYVRKNHLEMLQMFRRDSQIKSPKRKLDSILSSPIKTNISPNRKIVFDDSDDDFIGGNNDHRSQRPTKSNDCDSSFTKHKVRRKKIGSAFLELEAEVSDERDSGDELTDDSAGSLAEFLCDDHVAHREDMQAHYMRSVKSPVKGVFKIPQLPKKIDNADVLSQFVEEDNYEMDSFCVDSHMGLTQFNDVSELELAEILLEERKAKKRRPNPIEDDGSPLIRRKNKKVKRQIHSDSDDSS